MYGNKIRLIRINRGLNQESVAKKIGISQNAYSKIENNHKKLNSDILQKLANIFGVTVEDITSPEPVIVNYRNNDSGSISNENNYHISAKLLEQLTHQLSEKDKQIERLIALLAEKKK
jgi:Predicted transcriptional regulators